MIYLDHANLEHMNAELPKEIKNEKSETKKDYKIYYPKFDSFFHILGLVALFFSKMCVIVFVIPLLIVLFLLGSFLLIMIFLIFKHVFYISIFL